MDRVTLKKQLKAVAGGSRLDILAFLKKRRTGTVTQIAEEVGRSVKTVSTHLLFLEQAGIVRRRPRGQQVTYRLALSQEKAVRQVLALL